MGRREELAAQVRGLATESPYVVEDTEDGFDVRIDLAGARWHGLVAGAALSAVVVHHVRVDPDGGYVLVDERRDVTWRPGLGRALVRTAAASLGLRERTAERRRVSPLLVGGLAAGALVVVVLLVAVLS